MFYPKMTIQEVLLTLGKEYMKANDIEHSIADAIYYGNVLLSEYCSNQTIFFTTGNNGGAYINNDELVEMFQKKERERIVQFQPTEMYYDYCVRQYDDKVIKSNILIEKYNYKTINNVLSNNVTLCLNHLNNIEWQIYQPLSKFHRLDWHNDDKADDNYKAECIEIESHYEKLKNKVFYFNHTMDRRGRIYCNSYPLTYQGDEYQKAMLEPTRKYLTDDTAMKYIQHDIANHFGLDKATFGEKEQFVQSNEDFRLKLVLSNPDKSVLLKQAKEPLLFYKAVDKYYQAKEGKEINYFSKIDATASGMQILAICSQSPELAKYTNLTDGTKCYDYYLEAKKALDLQEKDEHKVEVRKLFKKAVMTYWYNSKAVITKTSESLKELGYDVSEQELTQAIEKCSFGAHKIKDLANKLFEMIPKDVTNIEYIMPDGFIVDIPMLKPKAQSVSTSHYSATFRYYVNEYHYETNHRAIIANIIHSIDSYICRQMIRKLSNYTKIAAIHDCYLVNPNYVPLARKFYKETLASIATDNVLASIVAQINPEFYEANKEALDIKEMSFDITSDYCLS